MFSLSGKSSNISCDIFPPLILEDGDYEIGLVELNVYNSIPNVEKGVNDKFHYGQDKVITIDEGSYEIDEIVDFINKHSGREDKLLNLTANTNTLKSKMTCLEDVHFEKENSIGGLFGFKKQVYKATDHSGNEIKKKTHISENVINIISVNTIRVECNVARGSFENGREGHVLHEFFPSVGTGYKIVEVPNTIIYLPVNVRRIDNLTVTLRDQNGRLVNFRGETISLRLHLRKRYGSDI